MIDAISDLNSFEHQQDVREVFAFVHISKNFTLDGAFEAFAGLSRPEAAASDDDEPQVNPDNWGQT